MPAPITDPLWLRAEARPTEARTPLLPEGVAELLSRGRRVVVEDSETRIVPTRAYAEAGAIIAEPGSWVDAPPEATILGLKELPDSSEPLRHRHVMFGHAYKGQPEGPALLDRFRRGGGRLLDLEYLTDETGRRLAAFGYWAGYAGAAVSVLVWTAQQTGQPPAPVARKDSAASWLAEIQARMVALGGTRPIAIVIGAKGRVGTGATDLLTALGIPVTAWDMAETAHGGPFPEIAAHDLFLNCILAGPGVPVFAPPEILPGPRRLTVIGDIACDPGAPYNPVPLYDRATTWDAPAVRVHDAPTLDIMAIDNLPSLLPREASEDFAGQLLPLLLDPDHPAWHRASARFDAALAG